MNEMKDTVKTVDGVGGTETKTFLKLALKLLACLLDF